MQESWLSTAYVKYAYNLVQNVFTWHSETGDQQGKIDLTGAVFEMHTKDIYIKSAKGKIHQIRFATFVPPPVVCVVWREAVTAAADDMLEWPIGRVLG